MSYAIEVQNVETRLVDVRGQAFEGKIFLHTVSDHNYQPETMRDRLNDPASDIRLDLDSKGSE